MPKQRGNQKRLVAAVKVAATGLAPVSEPGCGSRETCSVQRSPSQYLRSLSLVGSGARLAGGREEIEVRLTNRLRRFGPDWLTEGCRYG
jgi:hypothetical protein